MANSNIKKIIFFIYVTLKLIKFGHKQIKHNFNYMQSLSLNQLWSFIFSSTLQNSKTQKMLKLKKRRL